MACVVGCVDVRGDVWVLVACERARGMLLSLTLLSVALSS